MIKQFSRKNSFITGWFLFVMTSTWNCSDLGTNPDNEDNNVTIGVISYTEDIQAIFNSNCTVCHPNSAQLNLTSYSGLMAGGTHGDVVIPGDGAGSIIIQKLGSSPPFGDQMPQGAASLSATKIELITAWIDAGAKNN
mgnify:CR=1 FL=1